MKIPRYIVYSAIAAAGAGALVLIARRQVYRPMRFPRGRWETRAELGAESVWLRTPDGLHINGWWLPVKEARLVHLYLHGKAGNVSHRGEHMDAVRDAGASILVIDYRGYGKSQGYPTESGLYRDAEAGYRFLRDRGFEPRQIVVHGSSIGTAVAVDLAVRFPAGGVILEAPFTSAPAAAHRMVPYLGPLLVRGFRTDEKIGRLQAPLLIIHGEEDEVVGQDMGRALFEAAPDPKQFWSIPGAGHNDIVEAGGAEYLQRLRAFHESLTVSGHQQATSH